jgi:hypothetical protein
MDWNGFGGEAMESDMVISKDKIRVKVSRKEIKKKKKN